MPTQPNYTLPALAVLDGARTPFAKAYGALAGVRADELGRIALRGALDRAGVDAADVEQVVFGNVAGPADASNIARVIALRSEVPEDRIAHTVNRNCASGMEAIVAAWQTLGNRESGADPKALVVAGGTESMSNIPLLWSPEMAEVLMQAGRARSMWQKVKAFAGVRPRMLKPVPAVRLGLTDPVGGLNMGETAEVLAREFEITRDEQDAFAMESHKKAAAAQERCFLSGEIVPVSSEAAHGRPVEKDVGPRANQSMEALAKLKPIFDKNGTVTPGNSCPLTDGAAALIVTSAEHAKSMDREPLGYVRSYAVAGCDPRRMGLGPVYATDKLLKQTGLELDDFDLIEINEAFAAQVIACLRAFESEEFARNELSREAAIGKLDTTKLNIHGGAIALGHPVGTTGTRIVLTLLRALKEKGLKRGLATLCIGGGQGMAMVVEAG